MADDDVNARPPFPRTRCDCRVCVQCCYDQPGSLAPGDMERIARYLKQALSDVFHFFWASPGALLRARDTGELYRIGTITPRHENGRCVFLSTDNRCRIHEVAPVGCAYFDTHLNTEEGVRRGIWLAMAQRSRPYQQLRGQLAIATHYRPRVA